MKYALIILFSFSFLCSHSQSLTVYDLCILRNVNEIEWINYYLTENKDYKYLGDFGVNEGGWKVYKFTRGKDVVEINLGSGTKDGQFFELTQIIYYVVDESAINLFNTSLNGYKFKIRSEEKLNNGDILSTWNGTLNNHDYLSLIFITKRGNEYKITI